MPISIQSKDDPVPLVAPLDRFDHTHLNLAGGKGANLGELVRAGFDIPPGFVITTAAYDLLLQKDGLRERIIDLLKNAKQPMFLVCVTDQVKRLSASGLKKPAKSEGSGVARKARVG